MSLVMTAPHGLRQTSSTSRSPPQGPASTDVTWGHARGPARFLGKLMGVIFNMDKMVGRDFETGLASLKAIAERH